MPGNRNDCRAYAESGVDQYCSVAHVTADGCYQGNPRVITPCRNPTDGSELPDWKEELNTVHKRIRTRVEHALARMKSWNIPLEADRLCREAGRGGDQH